jgi:hypothetical protein
MDVLLLLLLLLVRLEQAPFGKRDRLAQNVDVADVIGQDQNQRRIKIGTLFVVEATMRSTMARNASSGFTKFELAESGMTKPSVQPGEANVKSTIPEARANAASSKPRVGWRKRAAT